MAPTFTPMLYPCGVTRIGDLFGLAQQRQQRLLFVFGRVEEISYVTAHDNQGMAGRHGVAVGERKRKRVVEEGVDWKAERTGDLCRHVTSFKEPGPH